MDIEKPDKPNEIAAFFVAGLVAIAVVYLVITYLLDTFLVRAALSIAIVGLGYLAVVRRRRQKSS